MLRKVPLFFLSATRRGSDDRSTWSRPRTGGRDRARTEPAALMVDPVTQTSHPKPADARRAHAREAPLELDDPLAPRATVVTANHGVDATHEGGGRRGKP